MDILHSRKCRFDVIYIVTYFGKITVGKWKLDQMSSSALFLKVAGPKGSL